MGKFRSYINRRFIESNQSLVEAMLYTNKKQGRRNNVVARACLVLQLYLKYVIFHTTIIEERQKKMGKALYPESRANQNTEIKNILQKMTEYECVTFDMWGVLFYEALDMQQLLALAEVKEYCIGISDMQDARTLLNTEQIRHVENIIMDFALENPAMRNLLNAAVRQGKNVYIYNNSDYPDEFIHKILNRHSYDISLGKEGLHIANKSVGRDEIKQNKRMNEKVSFPILLFGEFVNCIQHVIII